MHSASANSQTIFRHIRHLYFSFSAVQGIQSLFVRIAATYTTGYVSVVPILLGDLPFQSSFPMPSPTRSSQRTKFNTISRNPESKHMCINTKQDEKSMYQTYNQSSLFSEHRK
ncbi:hypothetical protein EJ08DRAFT_27147 [Tothia fuscella]|uniref:Uncharacterized protein n=1 Tax=Tothia fuscella TaxID=1048955 RepID=A0A9P4TT42_9PEZI|nr:hypothetical protein EJ08DRAFT_27147 [Tothia fuscella]